jgi:hypothetical protein
MKQDEQIEKQKQGVKAEEAETNIPKYLYGCSQLGIELFPR